MVLKEPSLLHDSVQTGPVDPKASQVEMRQSIDRITMTQTNATKAVVFGATGAIGTELIRILAREHKDWEIYAVTSLESNWEVTHLASLSLPNVHQVVGEPVDRSSVLSLSEPCDFIFCCVSFPTFSTKYWAQNWPILVDSLLAAVTVPSDRAVDHKKKLVFCDNLYAFGPGKDISVDTPRVSFKRLNNKPAVRALLHSKFHQHIKENPGTLTVVGGADFFGPHVDGGVLGRSMTANLVKGTMSAMVWGSVDVVHDFCYAPDLSRALAVAAVRPEALDRFWICPHAIHGKTLRQIAHDIARKVPPLGQKKKINLEVIGPITFALLSPFVDVMKDMKELLPFWTKDYTVDDSHFTNTFGLHATPYDNALYALVEYYREYKNESVFEFPPVECVYSPHELEEAERQRLIP